MSEQHTPEGIADQIVLGYQSSYDACKDDILRDDIAAAIRSAVLAEREACAKVCDEYTRIFKSNSFYPAYGLDASAGAAREIGAAIRARSETK